MLDDLLGRTELKERIAALEEERDRLEARLEAESERRAAAVSARQDAEERINRLEDRIADLEGRLTDDPADRDVEVRRRERLRGGRLEAVLDRLESVDAGPEGVCTAAVDEAVPDTLRDVLGDRVALVARAAPCVVCADDAGVLAVALVPPIQPTSFCEWAAGVQLERAWFQPTGRFAFALVRADTFAVGTYDASERVAVEGFTSDVKSDHSKGGFSQARFERIRDGQIADHLERCRTVLDDVDADRLYVVGDERLAEEFADRATVTAAVDATGDPEAALEDAFASFWTTRLVGL